MDQIFWNLSAFLIFSNNNINNLEQILTACIKKLDKKSAFQYLGSSCTMEKKATFIIIKQIYNFASEYWYEQEEWIILNSKKN